MFLRYEFGKLSLFILKMLMATIFDLIALYKKLIKFYRRKII